MSIQLIISDASLGEEKLQALTRDLSLTLSKKAAIQAVMAQGEAQPGSKGEPITLGVLALTFLTGGSAVALIDVLKTYLLRNATLEIEVKNGDKSVKINLQNVQAKQVDQVLASIKQLIGTEPHD